MLLHPVLKCFVAMAPEHARSQTAQAYNPSLALEEKAPRHTQKTEDPNLHLHVPGPQVNCRLACCSLAAFR